jgi:ABC-type polysaccharide/polyol phosphate export permease
MATPRSTATAVFSASNAARPGFLGLIRQGLREIFSNVHLLRYLVSADLKRTHADTLIGQVWWIVDPFLQMLVYVVLVTVIFSRPTPDYPLFVFCAILPWKWFNTTLRDAASSVTARNTLIRQIQFPKIVLPTASVLAGTASFVIGWVALGALLLVYHSHIHHELLLFPVVAAVQLVFTFALAVFLSAANAFYRDVQNVLVHALRLWFYVSPGLYSLSQLEKSGAKDIIAFNPFTPIFESYRNIVYGDAQMRPLPPDWGGLAVVLAVSVVLLLLSIGLFKRVEPAFAKII